MSVVYSGDLSSAMSGSNIINGLNADKEDTKSMINALQDFISNTTDKLVGEGYDSVRQHLQGYITILEARMKIADDIIAAIKSACSTMITYMDGEAKLDTNDLESYKSQLIKLQNKLDGLVYSINNYDPDTAEVSLSSLRASYFQCMNDIKDVKRMIDLLENLDAADAGAYGSYMSSEQGITSLSNGTSNISTINI